MYCIMILTEKRTQLYLPIDLYRAVQQAAKARGLSLAALARQALEQYLGHMTKRRTNWATDPLHRLGGCIKNGPRDLSTSVDEEIYR